MKQIVLTCLIVILSSSTAAAQTEIIGLRVYANDDEYLPPVISTQGQVTIEFDIKSTVAPDLRIVFFHASKDWEIDKNVLVNDGVNNKSAMLQYTVAPLGVMYYRFHYKNFFPDAMGVVRLRFSGNYIFFIVENNKEDQVLAEGRFIISENLLAPSMTVDNRYADEGSSPLNERLQFSVDVPVPLADSDPAAGNIVHQQVKAVDIYQNWRLHYPIRIDVDDNSPDTFVEDFYTQNKKFIVRKVLVGNEYRRLDISSPRLYPNYQPVRLLQGADLSRFQWQGKNDANGAAKIKPFTGLNSDYLEVLFRLKLPQPLDRDIFLAGSFNSWFPTLDSRMVFDTSIGEYQQVRWIRRGVHDYQYVIGRIDSSGIVDQDWIALEGNGWRTIHRYIAVVYYKDERNGGFDRILGTTTAKSPGGRNETTKR